MNSSVVRSISDLRAVLAAQRAENKSVGVVPTMGALHEGHLSLVFEAARRTDVVVVTVFVNPTQFGPGEDFERYPRTLDRDRELAEGAGAQILFAPSADEMYPSEERTRVRVAGLSDGMCGAVRPGHFDGVATIVTKIFNVVGAGTYFFGKKDYQQWRLIERLATDLLVPVKVVGLPTVREADGLAMSSRNEFLSPEARRQARALPRALAAAVARFQGGERRRTALYEAVYEVLRSASLSAEYVELRDALSLQEAPERIVGEDWVLALSVRVGDTRLIDNVVLGEGDGLIQALGNTDADGSEEPQRRRAQDPGA